MTATWLIKDSYIYPFYQSSYCVLHFISTSYFTQKQLKMKTNRSHILSCLFLLCPLGVLSGGFISNDYCDDSFSIELAIDSEKLLLMDICITCLKC